MCDISHRGLRINPQWKDLTCDNDVAWPGAEAQRQAAR
ncbi:hypothetical protein I546_1115 [Mycobacterium kansasii 732]|nr:hypothetical protein I546_1115 [Mycobacterium kansasii 732]